MLLSAMSVLVVAQSSSEIPEGLMNNPVFSYKYCELCSTKTHHPIKQEHINILSAKYLSSTVQETNKTPPE